VKQKKKQNLCSFGCSKRTGRRARLAADGGRWRLVLCAAAVMFATVVVVVMVVVVLLLLLRFGSRCFKPEWACRLAGAFAVRRKRDAGRCASKNGCLTAAASLCCADSGGHVQFGQVLVAVVDNWGHAACVCVLVFSIERSFSPSRRPRSKRKHAQATSLN